MIANNEFTKSGGELMSMMNLCSQVYSDKKGKEEVEDLIIKIGDEYLSRVIL